MKREGITLKYEVLNIKSDALNMNTEVITISLPVLFTDSVLYKVAVDLEFGRKHKL